MSKVQINCFLTQDAAQHLKVLSRQQHQSYGEVLSVLLMESPEPATIDLTAVIAAIAAIEQRLDAIERATIPNRQLSTIATDRDEREHSVLELHQQEISGRQIAQRLGIGETTVRRILKKSAHTHNP